MTDTVKQSEAPGILPPDGIDAHVWARIEAYIAHRFTPREVVWFVEGEGEWTPPLGPVNTMSAERWEADHWLSVTPARTAFGGYDLPSEGPYRITANVGAGEVPAAVLEAARRLQGYAQGHDAIEAGMTAGSVRADVMTITAEGPQNWAAVGLQNSGAADLLRPYRRA